MKRGTKVRLRAPEIDERIVIEQRIDTDTDEAESLVEWHENGELVRAWFADRDLEEVQP